MAGFTYKIESGVPIVSSEVRQNFEDLQGVVNNLKDRNFEHGAINTRHLNGSAPPGWDAYAEVCNETISEEEFYLGNARPVKRIGYASWAPTDTGVTRVHVSTEFTEDSAFPAMASLDTRGLAGTRGFTLVAIANVEIIDLISTGLDGDVFEPSEDVYISFKLQYERLEGVFVDFVSNSVRKVTIGSSLRRADIVLASTFGIARVSEGPPEDLRVRLMAIVQPAPPATDPVGHVGYQLGGTIQVFGGLR